MEISKSLEHAALEAVESHEEAEALIPIADTPFFLSRTGEGIMAHGIVTVGEEKYYIGTLLEIEDQT